MSRLSETYQKSLRRKARLKSTVRGTSERPRLSVRISNKHISAQIIDDQKSVTLVGYTTVNSKLKGTQTEKSVIVGQEIAKLAKTKKVKKVVFDRGSSLYHGRVKALADAARKEGLEF